MKVVSGHKWKVGKILQAGQKAVHTELQCVFMWWHLWLPVGFVLQNIYDEIVHLGTDPPSGISIPYPESMLPALLVFLWADVGCPVCVAFIS